MKRLLLLLLLLFATPAFAIDVKTLDAGKGSEVWFAEDHTVPVVTLVASLPAGSAYDPPGREGLAAFAAAMLDEGAGNLDSRAFHDALADRAIRLDARVTRDDMVVTLETLRENLPAAMHLLQMALAHPRFDAAAASRVRTQLIQGLQQGESDPPTVADRAFMKAFFNGHPYGHPPDGEIAGLAAVTPAVLHAFAHGHWVRGGLKLAIAGDLTADAAAKLAAGLLKPLPASAPPPPPVVGRLGQPGIHVVPMAVPQPTVMFGLPGIMRADPAFVPGYVANYILGGGGFASRLMAAVRVKRGLAYGIDTELTPWHRASVMVGAVATRADAVRQTIQVVRDTMADFAQSGPTQQELDDAKTYLTGSFPLAFASDAGIAAQLATFQREGLDAGYVARRNALIRAVTLDAVRRAAKRLYDPARLTVVVAGTPVGGRKPGRKPAVR